MRNFLRFPFSAEDQKAIASTLKADDVPFALAPGPNQPYPQSLKLTFTAPATTPQVRALFPGKLTFLVSENAPGTLPDWKAVRRADYASYKTIGTLHVALVSANKRSAGGSSRAVRWSEFATHTSTLPVRPNMVWYSPVKVSEAFLFETLPNLPGDVSHNGHTVPRGDDWIKHAVAAFLRGDFKPELRLGTHAEADAVAKYTMPEVYPEAGQLTLYVTTASGWPPLDGPDSLYDKLTNQHVSQGITQMSPRHLRNAPLPARWVLQELRPKLVDGNGPVATAALAGASPVRYVPLRFTRAWAHEVKLDGKPRAIQTRSVHLPTQSVEVKNAAGAVVHQQRLPAHGLVVLKDPPGQLTITLTGDLPYLAGGPNAWREPAGAVPLTFDLAQTPAPHIIVRRPIPDEMMADKRRPKALPKVSACTYFSLRRTVRGMVDHYVTGGRLNYEGAQSPQDVIDLLKAAWTALSKSDNDLKELRPDLVTKNRPRTNMKYEEIAPEARKLLIVLRALFPGPAKWVSPGPASGAKRTDGDVFYHLWQSRQSEFSNPETRGFYPDNMVGLGAPGAAANLGLATLVLVQRKHLEPPVEYRDKVVEEMLNNLHAGDLLQFWTKLDDFDRIRTRNEPRVDSGHSPIFSHYETIGWWSMWVIDHRGDTRCPVEVDANGKRTLLWRENVREFWVAARWK